MKEIVVISGKGGTGKTSLTAAFAALANGAVLADCDVDAADLHLILDPQVLAQNEFISGHEAIIDPAKCIGCGACLANCRFEAVRQTDILTASGERLPAIDPFACEGCGVCVRFCPVQAIDFPSRHCGAWYLSSTRFGPMVHARLGVAAENSGKLVSLVRREARRIATDEGRDLILVDGPPGIGCPVIASMTGASAVLIVTEPTLSGVHDMERVMKLGAHFRLPVHVCVNKWDINADMTGRIETKAIEAGAIVVGRIPFSSEVTQAQLAGKSLIEYSDGPVSNAVRKIWDSLCWHVDATETSSLERSATN